MSTCFKFSERYAAYYTQDIRGLKQYELTDHLGNVLATVSDKRAAGITTTLLSGADSIVTFRPVLASAYDYYPFGSFMPGRYMEDSNSYCFTTTETKYVVVPFLEIATPSSGPSALINPDAGAPPTVTDVPGGGVDIEFDPVDAGTMASVTFPSGIDAPANTQVEADLEVSVLDAVFNISIVDDSTGNVLASKQVANLQGNTKLLKIIIPNPASTTGIRVTLDQAGVNTNVIRINYVKSTHYTTVSVNVVSTVCNTEKYPFGFNGQMKVNEWAGLGNHYTAEHWEYSPPTGRRYNKDDWNHNPSVSPYATFDNSPIWKNDPKGDDPSTDVTAKGDGTYSVVQGQGTANDGDKNIYVNNDKGQRTGEVVGQSLTPNSFYGDNGKPVVGATINPNDQSGTNFLNNEIMKPGLGLVDYMQNATGKGLYDFKTRGMGDLKGTPADQYKYRGMPVDGVKGLGGGGKPTFASGRDIGNVGAGYVAGSHGLPWAAARLGFDALQTKQNHWVPQTEGAPTHQAEKVGFHLGQAVFKVQYHEDVKRIQQFDAQRTYPWGPK